MGALIRTKGTKLLGAHFNQEFSTFIHFWRDLQTSNPHDFFDTTTVAGGSRNVDLLDVTNRAKDTTKGQRHTRRTDNKCLLPDVEGHHVHKNLETRWLWFLTLGNVAAGALTQANHNKIAAGIYKGLMTPWIIPGSPPVPYYNHITFDAVEASSLQDVAVTDHLEEGIRCVQIVLITPPMSPTASGTLPALDPDVP